MKRRRPYRDVSRSDKRQRVGDNSTPKAAFHPTVPLLDQYYQEVRSLRVYLASRLPKSSKKRRRRLLRYGLQSQPAAEPKDDLAVAELLDRILVGTARHLPDLDLDVIEQDISVFTQQVSETDITLTPSSRHLKQSEVGGD